MATSRRTSGSDPLDAAQRAADLVTALDGGDAELDRVRSVLRHHGEPILVGASDLPALRAAAPAVRAVFAATDTATAVSAINELFAGHAAAPRLTDHDGTAWHLHVDQDTDDWGRWFAASSALALAVLLARWQAPPGALCAAPGCGAPFVAHGGGTPRRYCSARCATRVRVARHRDRD